MGPWDWDCGWVLCDLLPIAIAYRKAPAGNSRGFFLFQIEIFDNGFKFVSMVITALLQFLFAYLLLILLTPRRGKLVAKPQQLAPVC